MRPDRDAILKALENVIDPELKRPVTELDMVRDVVVDGLKRRAPVLAPPAVGRLRGGAKCPRQAP